MTYRPYKTGRAKTRLRRHEKVALYQEAEKQTEKTILPEVKKFLNELPFPLRFRSAVQILLGRF
jgi:hypothetical protein